MQSFGIGQVRRVVVLIEETSGRQHGWEILEPEAVRWDFAGLGANGTRAKVSATGTFYRMSKAAQEHSEIEAGRLELEE
jgi:hypothetical protein